MQLTPKQKGNITEISCLLAFMQNGFKVSLPYGDDCKYDFVADWHGKLLRVQCKTSRALPNNDGFKFNPRSVLVNTSTVKTTLYTSEDIDFFATMFDDKCYILPVENSSNVKVLRFDYPINGQKKGIYLAADYTLEGLVEKLQANNTL